MSSAHVYRSTTHNLHHSKAEFKMGPVQAAICILHWPVELKRKGKVIPVLIFLNGHHAIKVYWGSGSIDPRIL
jgi:hypothetical protein